MPEFLTRMKQRKLVQWAIAYVAGAWAVLQMLDLVAQEFGWPGTVMRIITVVLGIGFFVALVLAWYHGERSAQRVGGIELLMLAALLVIAAVAVSWVRYRRVPTSVASVVHTATASVAKAQTAHASVSPAASTAAVVPSMAATIPAKSVAVLPFENLSADKNNEYFVAGIQDLILTKLADIGGLKVISRTSTAMYASHPANLATIGRQLRVATVLEGSVQKQGNQVLINVQLIDAKSDSHIWAKAYTKTLTNVFGVEGEVAGKIAAALKTKLSPTEAARLSVTPTHNEAASDAFLRAQYLARQGTVNRNADDWKAAIGLYRQAIRYDPGFALAWARVSIVESFRGWFSGGDVDVQQLNARARSDAEQSLKLAAHAPASQLALGYSDYYGRQNYTGALKAFQAALAAQPNNVDALTALGAIERRLGRFKAAIATFREAFALDPRNSGLAVLVGRTYASIGRYPDALRWLRRATAIDPNDFTAQRLYAFVIVQHTGNIARALKSVRGTAPQAVMMRAALLEMQRHYTKALSLVDSVPTRRWSTQYIFSKALVQADLYRLMGDATRASPLYQQEAKQAQEHVGMGSGKHQIKAWLQLAHAELGLGHAQKGVKDAGHALALAKQSGDREAISGAMETVAEQYAEARRADLAVPLLVRAMSTPGGGLYSPVMLWIDPVWDPIRHDPRFQALLHKYAKYKPAVTYPIPPASTFASAPDHP